MRTHKLLIIITNLSIFFTSRDLPEICLITFASDRDASVLKRPSAECGLYICYGICADYMIYAESNDDRAMHHHSRIHHIYAHSRKAYLYKTKNIIMILLRAARDLHAAHIIEHIYSLRVYALKVSVVHVRV